MSGFLQIYFIEKVYGYAYPITFVAFIIGMVVMLSGGSMQTVSMRMRWFAEVCGVLVMAVVFASICYVILGDPKTNLVLFVVMLIYTLVSRDYKRMAKWLMVTVYFSTNLQVIILGSNLTGLLRQINFKWVGPEDGFDTTGVIVMIIILLIALFIRKFNVTDFPYHADRYAILIMLISVMGLVIYSMGYESDLSNGRLLILSTMFTTVELLAYYLFYVISKEQNDKVALMLLQQKSSSEREYFKLTQANQEEMRLLRHELKNYFGYASALLQQKRYEEALTMFEEVTEEVFGDTLVIDCGQDVINSVMNTVYHRCKSRGIHLNHHIVVPSQLGIRDSELYSLLMNLLENAMEGCSDVEKPVIDITIKVHGKQLLIRVTNPVSREIRYSRRLTLKTTKADSGFHGYGTKIIGIIASKNNGIVQYDIDSGAFKVDVMLSLG